MKRLTSTERQGSGGNRSRGSGGSDRSLGRPPVRSGSQLGQSAPVLSASLSREESAGLVTAPNVNLSSNFGALNLSGQSSSNEQQLPPYGVRDVRAAWNQTIQNFTAATQASEASGDVPQRQRGLLPERQEPADEQPPYVPPPVDEAPAPEDEGADGAGAGGVCPCSVSSGGAAGLAVAERADLLGGRRGLSSAARFAEASQPRR